MELLDSWLGCRDYTDKDEAIDALIQEKERLTSGLCLGQQIVLMLLMKNHYQLASSELIERLEIEFERVFYIQFLQMIIQDLFLNEEKKSDILKYLSMDTNTDVDSLDHLSVFFKFPFIDDYLPEKDLYRTSRVLSLHSRDFSTLASFLEQEIKQAKDVFKEQVDWTLMGQIAIYFSWPKSHALFFQLTDILRFYDAGVNTPGFYEFPNEELFVKGLANHLIKLMTKGKKQTKLTMGFVAIPKSKMKVN